MRESLTNNYPILHSLTAAYSAWTSGTVKSLKHTLLAALKQMMMQPKLATQNWKEIIIATSTIINPTVPIRLASN